MCDLAHTHKNLLCHREQFLNSHWLFTQNPNLAQAWNNSWHGPVRRQVLSIIDLRRILFVASQIHCNGATFCCLLFKKNRTFEKKINRHCLHIYNMLPSKIAVKTRTAEPDLVIKKFALNSFRHLLVNGTNTFIKVRIFTAAA